MHYALIGGKVLTHARIAEYKEFKIEVASGVKHFSILHIFIISIIIQVDPQFVLIRA